MARAVHLECEMLRVDRLLVVSTAAVAGAYAVCALVPASLAVAACALALARTHARVTALLVLVVFGVGAFRAHAALAAHETKRRTAVTRTERGIVAGVVATSPVLAGDRLRVDVDDARGRVSLRVPFDVDVARGDRVEAIAQLAPPHRFWNEASDPRPQEARRGVLLSGAADDMIVVSRGHGVRALVDRARARIRRRILATFPVATSGMARALVLGEDDLAAADRDAFRRSGLAHLLAVSGMHLVLVVAGSVAVVRAVFVRIGAIAARLDAGRLAAALGIPLTWLYAELAGASGSAVRAAWMTSAALLARLLARNADAQRALALSIAAMVVVDPLVAFDASFVLSVLATTGMIFLAPRVTMRFLPVVAARPIAATTAASLACAPVLAQMAPELPITGLFANVLAVPLGEAAALPLCMLHACLAGWPDAERGCALAASGALLGVRAFARAFAWGGLPVPTPTAGQLAATAAGLATAAIARRPRLAALGTLFALVILEAVARVPPRGKLRVTYLDVGQGDAALVDLPDGLLMLVDGGGLVGSPVDVGERVLAPVLRARRRSVIDVVVLTHPHPDHFLGLRSALSRVRVGAFWDTGQGEEEGVAGAYAELFAFLRGRGVRIQRPAQICGVQSIGGARVEVLAPCPEATSDRGPNDNSFVFAIDHGRRRFLFAGDAEQTLEQELARTRASALRADVLKVSHHGSRTSSTPPFLAAVKPSVAIVSCGVRNRFGHPHPETLSALDASGARILRTDRDGAIVVESDGASLDVYVRSTIPMYGRFL